MSAMDDYLAEAKRREAEHEKSLAHWQRMSIEMNYFVALIILLTFLAVIAMNFLFSIQSNALDRATHRAPPAMGGH
jgi:hypothetical protein